MNLRWVLLPGILLLALIFKFWLIANMEIMDEPSDATCYMVQILWNTNRYYGPGTGFVGRLFSEWDIPFRIGIEVAYLVSTLLVVKALFEWPTRSWLALALYLFVIFNPAPEELFSHILSDQVWLVEMLAGISVFIFFVREISKVRWFYLGVAALLFSLTVITRSTLIPMMAILLGWGLLAVLLPWLKEKRLKIDPLVFGGLALCLYGMVLFNYGISYWNSVHNGYFGLCVIDCREYQKFYMCLQSVGGPTGDKYFPVGDDRLKLIQQAGPQSSWFVEQLKKDKFYRNVSLKYYGKPELALTWFHWAVYEDLYADHDTRRTIALFKTIEDEIAQAGREKRIEVRSIIPLPDCRLAIVASAFPDALRHIATLTVSQPPQYAWYSSFGAPKFDDIYFTKALTRRVVTASPEREQLGKDLCAIYRPIYTCLLDALVVAFGMFAFLMIWQWKKIISISNYFLARQLFLLSFVAYFGWYLLFDASGLLAVTRYLILNNVLLPVLLVYYAGEAWQLYRKPERVL